MRFIGLDLAWSARNLTGAAVVEGDASHGRLVASTLLHGDDDVISFVLRKAADGPALVTIDAPLIVPNHTGRRPAEAEIGRTFARHQAGAHPANRTRLAVDGVVRGEAIVRRLENHNFLHRAEVEPRVPVRQVLEVYPHPAMVSIFNLSRTLKYKARPNRTPDERIRELARYLACLRSLECAEPALVGADELLGRETAGLIKARLKDYEDLLDGLMCAYVGHYLWRWGMARARVFGDIRRGYITTPIPPDQWRGTSDGSDE